jgi:hypothetical protein
MDADGELRRKAVADALLPVGPAAAGHVVSDTVDHDSDVLGRRSLAVAIRRRKGDQRRRRPSPGRNGDVEKLRRPFDGADRDRDRQHQQRRRDERGNHLAGVSRRRTAANE